MTEKGTHSYRLFFAVWPDESTQLWLDEQSEALHRVAQGRQVSMRQLHLTVAFVGEVASDLLEQVKTCGESVAQQAKSSVLPLEKLAVWDNGIGFAGSKQCPAELMGLVKSLNHALKEAGLPYETRRFKPHITLLRKADAACKLTNDLSDRLEMPIDHLSLVASRLTRGGPLYQELFRWPLLA